MHMHCDGCGCRVCHNTCDVCGQPCRSIHEVPVRDEVDAEFRGKLACASCYKLVTIMVPPGQGCEECGGPKGYRSPHDRTGSYLCVECRSALGLPVTAIKWLKA